VTAILSKVTRSRQRAETRTQFPAVSLSADEAREYSSIRFVSASAAPSLILHATPMRSSRLPMA
jgi:hypothetical protein